LKYGKENPEDLGKVDDADESDKVSSTVIEKMDRSFSDATDISKESKLDAFASGKESKETLKNGKGKLDDIDKADDTEEGDEVSSAVKEKKDRFSDATETSKDSKLEAFTTRKESSKEKSKSVKESSVGTGKVDDAEESD
jgi:conjugal transfer/entry exclusion protein